jgi:hypothetical protein
MIRTGRQRHTISDNASDDFPLSAPTPAHPGTPASQTAPTPSKHLPLPGRNGTGAGSVAACAARACAGAHAVALAQCRQAPSGR